MSISKSELRVTIAKVIALAYSSDGEMTLKILSEKGSARISVDQNGHATLSGSAGFLTFSGRPALEEVGVKIKRINVNFANHDGMKVGYTAAADLGSIQVSVVGSFDLESMITSCSGWLCQAARALRGRSEVHNRELQRAMGT